MKKIILLVTVFVTQLTIGQDFTSSISDYLTTNRTQLGLEQQDVNDVRVSSQSFSNSMDLYTVYASQNYQGIEVFNSTSSFAIKDDLVVVANLSLTESVSTKINTVTPSLNAMSAISNAATALGLQGPIGLNLLETTEDNTFVYSNGGISLENIPVRLVFQTMENESLRLAWDLSIYFMDASHYYSVRIDATTGALLDTIDWVNSCSFGEAAHTSHNSGEDGQSILFAEEATMTVNALGGAQYRVFPIPTESPNHGPDLLVGDPSDAVASPFGWHDTNGAAGAEFTITRGNNVHAQEDMNGNNGTGASPDGGPTLNFDFPYDFNNPPASMVDAATTNLFFWNNLMHDVFYQYGFDEESGNFQENNYGNAGNGSDSVNADAQDGSGTNNATFGTPPDGGNPRMTMFLWTGGSGPVVDILTINSGPLAGGYEGVPAGFGGAIPFPPLTEDMVVIEDDNAGESTDPNDGCDNLTNAGDLTGKIVIINRGICEFGFKSLAAEDEGAIAVIIVDRTSPSGNQYPLVMGGGVFGDQVTIPVLMVSETNGDAIINEILNNGPLNGTISGENVGQDIDGDVDNGIIAHEYGHGISNRLTGGPNNTGCLGNAEQMGEGWSDWAGLMLTMQPGAQPEDVRGIGTYATGQPTNGGGIRPAPYSTDFAVNNFTYGATNNGNISQPHGIGFVWATMLWDLNWALIDQYGVDTDLYNGTGGNNITMQLVLDGMKLQNCSPGFVDGRDAILEADELANGGDNRCLIWEVFARRGLGLSADQGSPFSRSDQTEAFDIPSDCTLGIEDQGSFDNNFTIYPNPSNGEINIQSLVDLGEVGVEIYDINGRKVFNQNVELNDIISINASNLTTGIYVMKINGRNYSHTFKLIIN